MGVTDRNSVGTVKNKESYTGLFWQANRQPELLVNSSKDELQGAKLNANKAIL